MKLRIPEISDEASELAQLLEDGKTVAEKIIELVSKLAQKFDVCRTILHEKVDPNEYGKERLNWQSAIGHVVTYNIRREKQPQRLSAEMDIYFRPDSSIQINIFEGLEQELAELWKKLTGNNDARSAAEIEGYLREMGKVGHQDIRLKLKFQSPAHDTSRTVAKSLQLSVRTKDPGEEARTCFEFEELALPEDGGREKIDETILLACARALKVFHAIMEIEERLALQSVLSAACYTGEQARNAIKNAHANAPN